MKPQRSFQVIQAKTHWRHLSGSAFGENCETVSPARHFGLFAAGIRGRASGEPWCDRNPAKRHVLVGTMKDERSFFTIHHSLSFKERRNDEMGQASLS